MTQITRDTLFDGRLVCYQYKNGYRFSLDAVLLANYAQLPEKSKVLELGMGSGVVSLILLYRNWNRLSWLTGIEIQMELADIAQLNLEENGFTEKAEVLMGDIRKPRSLGLAAESFDVVICNPPFYPPGTGRRSLGKTQSVARHQIYGGIVEFLTAAARYVKNGGLVFFVYPAERLQEALQAARDHSLEPKKIRPVYSYPEAKNGTLVLMQMRKNGGTGLLLQPPLWIYTKKNGEYSDEVRHFYMPNYTL